MVDAVRVLKDAAASTGIQGGDARLVCLINFTPFFVKANGNP
jgi:hypothetical protein